MALKVTKNARTIADGSRPAVLYSSLQHAREWISGEVNLRLLQYLVDNYNKDAEVTNLVNTRELVRDRGQPVAGTPSTTSACGGRTSATTTGTT